MEKKGGMVSGGCGRKKGKGMEAHVQGKERKKKGGGISNEPFLQILNARHPPLSIDDHFAEQVREAGAAELRIARAVQVAVVDGFAVGWRAETGGGGGFGW